MGSEAISLASDNVPVEAAPAGSPGGVFVPLLCLVAAFALLLLGSGIYLLFRPTSLMMFHWAGALGLGCAVESFRSWGRGLVPGLPAWEVYSLPFALWVAAYVLAIHALWWKVRRRIWYFWLSAVPLVAVASEIGQYLGWVPGYFDAVDLFAVVLGVLVPHFIVCLIKGKVTR